MLYYLRHLLLPVLLGFAACNSSPGEQPPAHSPAAPPAKTPAPAAQTLPSLPMDIAQNLAQNCTFIDYLYYELPLSMSFNEKNGIITAIRHISDAPAAKPPNCKPIGRVTYQNDGENLLEADLYYSPGCTFFIFLENNKPKYGNMMTPDGIKFYQDMIQRAGSMRQGG